MLFYVYVVNNRECRELNMPSQCDYIDEFDPDIHELDLMMIMWSYNLYCCYIIIRIVGLLTLKVCTSILLLLPFTKYCIHHSHFARFCIPRPPYLVQEVVCRLIKHVNINKKHTGRGLIIAIFCLFLSDYFYIFKY